MNKTNRNKLTAYKQLNNKALSSIAILSTCLLFTACSDGGFDDTGVGPTATLDDDTNAELSICASRLGRNSQELFQEMKELTNKESFVIATSPSKIDAENPFWDTTEADVICTEDTNDIYSFNLIQTVNEGQVVYGSSGTEYIGTINGGTVFGFDGQDIVANLESGTFFGGMGDDLIDSPIEHGLYTGWASVSVATNGLTGGEFFGDDGDDFVAQMNGGEFHGEADEDSVAILNFGKFYGGTGSDSVNDPYSGNLGEMFGGEFHGEEGADVAGNVNGGIIFGGAGDDLVQNLSFAKFEGMEGNDTVYSLNEFANFEGGADDDTVDSMTGGTFDGGDGVDSVESFSDGTLINVE